jgi:hypothetical protein
MLQCVNIDTRIYWRSILYVIFLLQIQMEELSVVSICIDCCKECCVYVWLVPCTVSIYVTPSLYF